MVWRFCVVRNKLSGLRNMNSLGILYFETACNTKAVRMKPFPWRCASDGTGKITSTGILMEKLETAFRY